MIVSLSKSYKNFLLHLSNFYIEEYMWNTLNENSYRVTSLAKCTLQRKFASTAESLEWSGAIICGKHQIWPLCFSQIVLDPSSLLSE